MTYSMTVDFIFESLCVFCMFSFFLGNNMTQKKSLKIISGFLFIASLVLILSDIYDTFVFFPVFLCILPLYINHILSYITWFMVYHLAFNILSIIGHIIVHLFYEKLYILDLSALPVYTTTDCLILIGFSIFFFISRKTKGKRMEILKYLNKKEYILILCICLLDSLIMLIAFIFFVSSYLPLSLNENSKIYFSIALLALIFLSIITFYLFCSIIQENITLQTVNKLNAENMALEQKYYETLSQNNRDLRAFRHELRSHVLALNTLVREKDWDELQQYLSHLTDTTEQINYFSTNSSIADAMINKFYQALPKSISFHIEGQFPLDMWITNMDLSIILSNLLKNAREACELLDEETEKEIILEIQYRNSQLSIRMENSSREYSPEEILHLETGKKNMRNHGFGLQNISQCVRKYNGTMDIQYQNGYFIVMLTLERTEIPGKE